MVSRGAVTLSPSGGGEDAVMKISLDQTVCIGCGLCSQISPENFSLDENSGTARVMRPETEDESVREAESSCPVACIRIE